MLEFILFIVGIDVILFCLLVIFEDQLIQFRFYFKIFLFTICMIIYWLLCLGTRSVYVSYKSENDDETKYIYLHQIVE